MPLALAAARPAMAFLTMAKVRSVAAVPVVVAMNISRPRAGVMTRPTVATPMGKL